MLWLLALKRFAQFSGRSSRGEFWQFVIAYAGIVGLVASYEASTYAYQTSGDAPLTLLVLSVGTIPCYAVTFRRLHDRDRSGWIIGGIWLLNGLWFAIYNSRDLTAGSMVDPVLSGVAFIDVLSTLAIVGYLIVQLSSPGIAAPNRFGSPPAEDRTSAAGPGRPAAQTSFVASSPRVDSLDMIQRLAGLRDQGALTDAEFDAQKAVILSAMSSRP